MSLLKRIESTFGFESEQAAGDEYATRPSHSDFDPMDNLIRQEVQQWVRRQAPPVNARQRLLLAAAQNQENQQTRDVVRQTTRKMRFQPNDQVRREILVSYLVITFQYNQTRIVA
jgi:hypothetical protein